jgi:hypothetical protein
MSEPIFTKNIMKNTASLLLFAALSPAALLLSGCSKGSTVAQTTEDAKAATVEVAADVKTAAIDSWDSIKDYTYEEREAFADGLDRLGKKSEADLAAMNAKLKGLPEATANTREAAVNEFNAASAAFKVQLVALRASTAETWAAAKENGI